LLTQSPYTKIADKIGRNPLTASTVSHGFSEAFIEYLQRVYTPDEALLVQHLELLPQFRTPDHVGRRSGTKAEYVEDILAVVNSKAGIVYKNGGYALPALGLLINFNQAYPEIREKTGWDIPDAIQPSSFVPLADEHCIFCGVCVDICPYRAMSLDTKNKRAKADPEQCVGCGACAIGCPENALRLIQYEPSAPLK